MRRKDREITDPSLIRRIIGNCSHCHLGLWDGQEVYIVPMNFGFEEENGQLRLYFHCAGEGRKLDILRRNPKVSFQMDTGFELRPQELACEYSAGFASVMGTGVMEFLPDPDAKRHGLSAILNHTTGTRKQWSFPDDSVGRVTVLRLNVERLSCKWAK